METDRISRIILRGEFHEECQRRLRAQELTAYCEFMTAIRMSGGMDDPKRELIDTIRKWFHIPDWRHQAEIRRVASDERLSLIADTLVGGFTSEDWVEEGYDKLQGEHTSKICPLVPSRDLVLKVIERRLKQHGVDLRAHEDMPDEEDIKQDIVEDRFRFKDKALRPENPHVASDHTELISEAMENEHPDTALYFASNLDLSDDFSGSEGRKRRREASGEDRTYSPDITNPTSTEKRKTEVLKDLQSRLSHSSSPDIDRAKRKIERAAKLLQEKEAAKLREKQGRNKRLSARQLLPGGERESSVESEASCLSQSGAVDQVMAMIATKPRPVRGRGITRVRGRGRGGPYAVRGRGRGRGRGRMTSQIPRDRAYTYRSVPSHPLPFPSNEPFPMDEPPSPSTRLGRPPKIKANGEEVKKRAPYKRKKPMFQTLSSENNFNETPTGVLKETQKTSVEMTPPFPYIEQMSKGSEFEEHYHHHHGDHQYYESYNFDRHQAHGQAYNQGANPPLPQLQPQSHQQPETPSKIRQKTKHTVIIQDPHESIPAAPKHAPNFVEYAEYRPKSTGPPAPPVQPQQVNSVIVRTPSINQSIPSNTPPKIINPHGVSKTYITITQNQKPTVNYYAPVPSKAATSPYENQSYVSSLPPPYRSPTLPNNSNATYKKRTQNLAAATTYTPQPDASSDSSDHTTQATSSTTVGSNSPTAVSITTASALAVRSRPAYDPKSSTMPAVSGSPLPTVASASAVRSLPTQSNSVPVVQRKAQPHILAGSKFQRAFAAATAAAASASVITTSNCGTATASQASIPIASPALPNNSVIQTLPSSTLTGSIVTSAPATPPGFTLSSPSNVVGLSKTNITIASPTGVNMTRGAGPNIIFVQKNASSSLSGQSTSQPGVVVKGTGKAVILRRANNNSNLMFLDFPKNNEVTNSSSTPPPPPVSQIVQSEGSVVKEEPVPIKKKEEEAHSEDSNEEEDEEIELIDLADDNVDSSLR